MQIQNLDCNWGNTIEALSYWHCEDLLFLTYLYIKRIFLKPPFFNIYNLILN